MRWHDMSCYVYKAVDPPVTQNPADGLPTWKPNKMGGVSISVKKMKGWCNAWQRAKLVAGWPAGSSRKFPCAPQKSTMLQQSCR